MENKPVLDLLSDGRALITWKKGALEFSLVIENDWDRGRIVKEMLGLMETYAEANNA